MSQHAHPPSIIATGNVSIHATAMFWAMPHLTKLPFGTADSHYGCCYDLSRTDRSSEKVMLSMTMAEVVCAANPLEGSSFVTLPPWFSYFPSSQRCAQSHSYWHM
jgi:hypothetical protein